MSVVALKLIPLRWPGTCSRCSRALPARTRAWWDAQARTVICRSCLPPGQDLELLNPALPDSGVAGGSARREAERRRAKRVARVRDKHPLLGELILHASAEPQHISAFDTGAAGEERLGHRLDTLRDHGVLSLHDRRRPNSQGNIDHLVVAPSGVYVVDAKRYQGRVHKQIVGGLFNSRERLYVERRDCSELATKVRRQLADVASAIERDGYDLPLHPVLCFIDAEWALLPRPFTFDRVLVTWPRALLERLLEPKTIGFDTTCSVVELLAQRFLPA